MSAGLTCGCDSDWCPEPGDWYWDGHTSDYMPLPFKRAKKCCSCHGRIMPGQLAVAHGRMKVPNTDVEVKIYGEEGEVPLAADWMCERCGDLYNSLVELGYCINPRASMRQLVGDYAAQHLEEH